MTAAANLGAMAIVLGLPTLATREAAALGAQGEWALVRGFIRVAHAWVSVAAVVFAVGALVLLKLGVLGASVSFGILSAVVFLAAMGAFVKLRAALVRGFGRVVIADIPDLIGRPTVVVALLSALLWRFGEAKIGVVLTVQVIGTAVGLAWSWSMLVRAEPPEVRSASPRSRAGHWFSETIPFAAVGLVTLLESQISLYLLGALSSSYEAGLYQAAVRLVGPITMGLVAVNLSVQPRVASAWRSGDRGRTQAVVTEAAVIGAVFALGVALLLLIFSSTFLGWFGVEFAEAKPALYYLLLGQLVNALSGSCGLVLSMTGHQRTALLGVICALAVNASVGSMLIPSHGAEGAAIAAAVGLVVWNVMMVVFSWRKTGLFTPAIRPLGRRRA